MVLALNQHPALVLNADFRPLSYYPLSLWPWQEAIKAVFMDRVNILSFYDREVHSPSTRLRLPSVISLKKYVPPARTPAFTRFNVFLRDEFRCVYCGAAEDLTFDHLVPRSQGGCTEWTNIVTACAHCNMTKGGRRPDQCHMFPKRAPKAPSVAELHNVGRKFPPRHLHSSWRDFLYWDAVLEP